MQAVWGFGSGCRGRRRRGSGGCGAGGAGGAGAGREAEARWVLSMTRGPLSWTRPVQAARSGARRPSMPSNGASASSGSWWRVPCRAGRAPAARAREAEPAGRQTPAMARTCGCPERRERRCSERSRRCCLAAAHARKQGQARQGQADPQHARERRRRGQARRLECRQEPRSHRGPCGCLPPILHVRKPQYSNRRYSNRRYSSTSAIRGSEGVPHPRE